MRLARAVTRCLWSRSKPLARTTNSVRLSEEEAREVHRILREMTARLREYAGSICATLTTMAELEIVFAKGRFANEFDCAIPRFGERLLLRDARHPCSKTCCGAEA